LLIVESSIKCNPEVELVEQNCTVVMHPYKYMGRYCSKEGKNRRKVTIQFQTPSFLTPPCYTSWVSLYFCAVHSARVALACIAYTSPAPPYSQQRRCHNR